jgi:hypothetical protein
MCREYYATVVFLEKGICLRLWTIACRVDNGFSSGSRKPVEMQGLRCCSCKIDGSVPASHTSIGGFDRVRQSIQPRRDRHFDGKFCLRQNLGEFQNIALYFRRASRMKKPAFNPESPRHRTMIEVGSWISQPEKDAAFGRRNQLAWSHQNVFSPLSSRLTASIKK